MSVAGPCRFCNATRQGEAIPVAELDGPPGLWHLCDRCFALFRTGFLDVRSPGLLRAYLVDRLFQLTSEEIRNLIYRGMMLVEREHRRHVLEDDPAPDSEGPRP